MTTAEKFSTMETLCQDLSRNAEPFDSPSWHSAVLREREQRVAARQEAYLDWETAKADLSKRLK